MNKISYHFGKNSASDWLAIVAVFTILLMVFVAAAFYQFSNYLKSDTIAERSAVAISTPASLDHAKLDEVVKYFTERQQKFNEIKTTKPRFVDPSK